MKASSRAQRQVDNAAESLATATQKQALNRIIKALKANPEKILPLLPLAEGEAMLKKMKTDADLGYWPQQYNKFTQIPKEFLKNLLCELIPQVDQNILDKVQRADRNAIPQIIAHCFGLDMGWALPKGALNKAVLKKALTTRYSLLGKRLSDLCAMLDDEYKLDFKEKAAVYKLLPENTDKDPTHVYTEVEHISGSKACLALVRPVAHVPPPRHCFTHCCAKRRPPTDSRTHHALCHQPLHQAAVNNAML
jgi:hypothetical protein